MPGSSAAVCTFTAKPFHAAVPVGTTGFAAPEGKAIILAAKGAQRLTPIPEVVSPLPAYHHILPGFQFRYCLCHLPKCVQGLHPQRGSDSRSQRVKIGIRDQLHTIQCRNTWKMPSSCVPCSGLSNYDSVRAF